MACGLFGVRHTLDLERASTLGIARTRDMPFVIPQIRPRTMLPNTSNVYTLKVDILNFDFVTASDPFLPALVVLTSPRYTRSMGADAVIGSKFKRKVRTAIP